MKKKRSVSAVTVLKLAVGLVCLCAQTASAGTLYVDASGTNATPPFTNWPTAATNIQNAIDAASLGDLVLVTNGTYASGGRPVTGFALTNRVAVTKALTVQSVNGPDVTVIQGNGPVGDTAARCAYLTNNAVLIGFTLTNGATRSAGNLDTEQCGGGVWCGSMSAVISNCVLAGNSAYYGGGGGVYFGTLTSCVLLLNTAFNGGGAYGSTLNNSVLSSNSATYGGGAYGSGCVLKNCLLNGNWAGSGGGVMYCRLTNCTLTANTADTGGGATGGGLAYCTLSGNWAYSYGGAAAASTLTNCVIVGNSSGLGGGGTYGSMLYNCTVVANSAAALGGGTYSGGLGNCIVYNNTAPGSSNYYQSQMHYCCTDPLPDSGTGKNITNAPLFVDEAGGNLRLQSNSPCINSGLINYAPFLSPDFDGNPRIAGGSVDIGAYEFQSPGSMLSYAWAQQYSLPTDGSADFADSDGDGMNNWQEWRAGTDPTDALSVLKMLAPTSGVSGVTVSWQSVAGIDYYVQRSTNLTSQPAFATLLYVGGQAGTTSYTDTTAVGPGPFFYRVKVRFPLR